MDCPFCGKPMIEGTITGDGRSQVYWKAGEGSPTLWEKMGGEGRVTAVKYKPFGKMETNSFFCKSCKKMIIDTDVTPNWG